MLGAQERSPQAETLRAHMHVQILVIPAEVGVQKTARVEHVTITALRTTRVSPPLHCGFHADSDTHSTRIRTVIPR